ncbi:serine/threonine-protein kinase [Candidatus Contubernalis alkaliaceticus]|uniref:serine/threonine-protein kinase n=1 Tax=Candidatus Contubernalis alkaliaceticus TaxID=338645 RepID=UPI001F4BF278|nr:serine/threonine-protein kinase [Candidatus Contubernalis alkalaceticus]UNC91133.1 protein kinase [Candidatus Contubernalis alkalaceticus]
MVRPNEILDEKYRIIKTLGQGGMSSVYLAQNIKLGNYWAIKEINTAGASKLNLLAEPEILKKLNHRCLPRIVDIIKINSFLYIIEDYIEGESLKDLLERQGKCHEQEVVKWAKQLCEILVYLHNLKPPIIYLDMKPGNIIIDENGDVKLIDFGIAKEHVEGQGSEYGVGTRGYAAPEQYTPGRTDARADIYGLGATLFHAATGINPREFLDDLTSVRNFPGLSEGAATIIEKCVQRDPAARYPSAGELLQNLNNIHTLNKEYRFSKIKKIVLAAAVFLVITASLGYYLVGLAYEKRVEESIARYNYYIEEGKTFYAREDYARALEQFEEALGHFDGEEAHLNLARVLLRLNREENMVDYLLDIMNQGILTKNGEVKYLLGTAYFNLADYRKSIWYFNQAVTQYDPGPESDHAYRDLAVSYGKVGEFGNAEKVLEEIFSRRNEQVHIIHYVRGELALAQQDYDKAQNEFKLSVQLDPSNTRYLLSLARLYHLLSSQGISSTEKQHYCKNAIELLMKAEQLDSNNITILNDLGRICYDAGLFFETLDPIISEQMFRDALVAFNKIKNLGIEDSALLVNIGILYDKLGQLPDARQAFVRALELDDNSSRANLVYGLFELKNGNYENSYKYLNKTVQLNQNPGEVETARNKINELKAKGWIY